MGRYLDMHENKSALILISVVAAAAVLVAGLIYIFNDDDQEYVGKYFVYTVSTPESGVTLDGTVRIEFVAISGDEVTVETTYDVYTVSSGVRTPLIVTTETSTENINEPFTGVYQRAETISTNWGPVGVDVYMESQDGETTTMYVGQDDEIPYKMVYSVNGFDLVLKLSATNAL